MLMDEQALEAQGVAALGARRKMDIDDPTAPPPSGAPPLSSASTLVSSAGSGGILSA